MMVTIKWKAPERELPTFGFVRPGDTIPLPADKANQYIRQGEAEEYRQAPATQKPKKED